jgi:hypothetical protein
MKTKEEVEKEFIDVFYIGNSPDVTAMQDFISQTRQADVEGLIEWIVNNQFTILQGYDITDVIKSEDIIAHLEQLKENI